MALLLKKRCQKITNGINFSVIIYTLIMRLLIIFSILFLFGTVNAQQNTLSKKNSVSEISKWPVLKTYIGENLSEVAMPLGGIGTGTVSIGGRGDLRDWEIGNSKRLN